MFEHDDHNQGCEKKYIYETKRVLRGEFLKRRAGYERMDVCVI